MKQPEAPPPTLPDIVEREMGIREYWFETFRRVLLVPVPGGLLLSIDVYSRGAAGDPVPEAEPLELAGARLSYRRLGVDPSSLAIAGVEPSAAEAVVLEAGGRVETISVRLLYKGLELQPSRDEVYKVYRRVVEAVESRDPEREPLDAQPAQPQGSLG